MLTKSVNSTNTGDVNFKKSKIWHVNCFDCINFLTHKLCCGLNLFRLNPKQLTLH